MKVFFDADALFTSSSSEHGAARAIVQFSNSLELVTSSICIEEANKALTLKMVPNTLNQIIKDFDIVLESQITTDRYLRFVYDKYDAHVVAAADASGCVMLTTYNTKDYLIGRLEDELDIRVLRPGEVLFFLRNVFA